MPEVEHSPGGAVARQVPSHEFRVRRWFGAPILSAFLRARDGAVFLPRGGRFRKRPRTAQARGTLDAAARRGGTLAKVRRVGARGWHPSILLGRSPRPRHKADGGGSTLWGRHGERYAK